MKAQILDQTGNKKSEIETKIFDGRIREDIVQKIVELEKVQQVYAPFVQAGMQTSASGNVRHLRHAWKSDRGKGMGRMPKKRMSRRGDRFSWVGAVVPATRGGRRAHPPKLIKNIGKVNRKELIIGLKSALAMSNSIDLIKEKYSTLKDKELTIKLPLIIDSSTIKLKTKDFITMINKITKEANGIAIKKKSIRAGKGKLRGRRYKKTAGILVVVGKQEVKKVSGIDFVKASEASVTNLASNGSRLMIFTEAGIKDMEARLFK